MAQIRIFFYGTLMNFKHELVTAAQDAVIPNATLYDLGVFPGLLLDGQMDVYGRVFTLEGDGKELAELLRMLDDYEGYNKKERTGLYVRKKTEAYTTNVAAEDPIDCWVYEFNNFGDRHGPWPPHAKIIPDGKWEPKGIMEPERENVEESDGMDS